VSGRGSRGGAAVVVSFDSAADLPACLGALERARGLGRVLVVDNASRDESGRAARSNGGEVLALERNTGFAGGCNRGWAAVQGGEPEWVAFLNPDVVVDEDCLARCGQLLAEAPDIGGVAARLMRPDRSTVDSVGQVLKPTTLEIRDRGYGQPLRPELLRTRDVLAACGALAVFRPEALRAASSDSGPWAESYFCFWEDLELGWRLSGLGWRIVALPDAVATHLRGAGAVAGGGPLRWRRPVELEACVLTNRWMTLIRHLHPLDLVPRLPLLLAWDLALVAMSVGRRPGLLRHLWLRWPLVMHEWSLRRAHIRKRLTELPW